MRLKHTLPVLSLTCIFCGIDGAYAQPKYSRTSRTTKDLARPSGFGLDLYVGGDGGYLSSFSGSEDESDKQGYLWGGKGLLTLLNNDLEIDLGGGFYKTQLPGGTDIVPTGEGNARNILENTLIKTDTGVLEIAARLRLNNSDGGTAVWSAGPVTAAFLGTNASFSADSNSSNRSALFIGGQLAVSFGQNWKPRIVAQYLTDINIFERQIHAVLLSLQFGKSVLTPATVIKDVRTRIVDETVKTVTVEKTVERAIVKESVRILLDAETVNFETNKANLLKRSEVFVRELGLILAQNKDKWTSVTIEGHTDSRGKLSYNNSLSLARAHAVRNVLLRSGIESSRMSAVGFGPLRPVDPRNNQIAWARNRRVELSFLGVEDPRWLKSVIVKLKTAVRSIPQ